MTRKTSTICSALLSLLLHNLIVIKSSLLLNDPLFDPSSPDPSPLLPTFFLAYALFTALSRFFTAPSRLAKIAVIFELNWACNTALIFAAIGFTTNRRFLAVAGGVAVSIDQFLWYVDICGYYIYPRGKFLVGVCKYLTWKQTSWMRVVTRCVAGEATKSEAMKSEANVTPL